MATRTKLVSKTDVGTAFEDVGDGLQPPSGIKWTFVELSFAFGVLGTAKAANARIKFDEEIYHEIRAEIHNANGAGRQKNREIIAIDVVQPHKLQVQARSDATTTEVRGQLTLEESAVTP